MARPPKYKCNEDYFSNIDTPEKAYIIGFLWADGHNNPRSGLTINIHRKDEDVLLFFKNQLDCNAPIVDKKGYSLFTINRKKIHNDLLVMGMFTNKTQNNLKFPNISKTLMRYFVLGFFDGDGSIWKKSKNCYAVSFANGYNFLISLKNYLSEEGIKSSDIQFRYSEDNKNSCQLSVTNMDNILKLYRLFYSEEIFSLSRKKQIFEEALKSSESMSKHNGVWDTIIDKYKQGVPQHEISEEMGIKPTTIRATIQRARKKNIIK